MSQERLGRLERRFQETGGVEDEAAWLRERVRCGELDEHRLLVAAYFGYPAAEVAAAQLGAGSSDLSPPEDFTEAGQQAWLRFYQAPRHVTLRPPEVLRILIAEAHHEVLAAFQVEGRSRWFREVAERLLIDAEEAALENRAWVPSPELRRGLAWGGPVTRAANEALLALVSQAAPNPQRVDREEVVREVVPWLLGYPDPLALRRAARLEGRG